MKIIGYARSGHEFDTAEDLRSFDIAAITPRDIKAESRGKNRRPKITDEPLWPNYIFGTVTTEEYYWLMTNLHRFKYLAGTFLIVPTKLERQLDIAVEAAERAAQRKLHSLLGEDIPSPYKPGEKLSVVAGPFLDWLGDQGVTFRKMAQAPHDQFPRIKVEAEVFGRVTEIELDPMHVRAG